MSATALHEPAVRLRPIERLEALCDPGSVQVLRSGVLSPRLGSRAVPGDGVVAATGTVAGPGFMPGSKQEQLGVIRHGASLVRAFAAARVPKLTVVLRKSYGGAYITMNSRDLGADLVVAWPDAELGIMSARAAIGIVHGRELKASDDPGADRVRLADAYAGEHLAAEASAACGFIDEIVEPVQTRARLAWALRTLAGAGA